MLGSLSLKNMQQKMDAMKLAGINNISIKERRLEGGNDKRTHRNASVCSVSAPLKGILFGSGLILLSLALLSLSFLLFKTSVQSSTDISRMAVIDRIKDEISSVENGYSVILARYVNATARGNNISFLETLPEGASGGFFTEISRFETFAQNNSDFAIVLNLSSLGTNLPLSLPKGVIYTHERGFGGNVTDVQSASAVVSYIVNVTVNRTGAPDLSWLSVNEVTNGVRFSIEAKGLTGTTRYDSRILSKNAQSELIIDVPGTTADPRIFVGNASDPSGLKIHNNGTDALFLNITVGINTTEALFVSFPQQTINITSGEYNISRTSAIRIR